MKMEVTETGRMALQEGHKTLSPRERQIMMLACGSESSRKMLAAMGQEAAVILHKLELKGLIQPAGMGGNSRIGTDAFSYSRFMDTQIGGPDPFQPSGSGHAAADNAPTMLGDSLFDQIARQDAGRVQRPAQITVTTVDFDLGLDDEPATNTARAAPLPPASPAVQAAAVLPPAGARSLNASKMYVIAMLHTLRSQDASDLIMDIHSSKTEDDLVTHLMRGVEYFHHASTPEHAARMRTKLHQIMPEQHQVRLELRR